MADLLETIKDFARGVIKGNTTDFVDIANMTPQAKLLGVIRERVLGQKTPEPTGDQVYEKITGDKPTGSLAETAGTFVSPEAPAAALKAIIIGAARIPSRMIARQAAEKAGFKTEAELFSQSGAYKDIGGVLRTTLSDAGASIDWESLARNTPGIERRLSDVVSHPKLFELYPELKTFKVVAENTGGNLGGFNPEEKLIAISDRASKRDALSIVLHELQHGVQTLDSTERGGNIKQFLPHNPEVVQRVVNKARETGDPTAIKAAENLKTKFNKSIKEAETKYMNLPGEQEARFTQQTMNLSDQELGAVVLDLLKRNSGPQTYDTRALPK